MIYNIYFWYIKDDALWCLQNCLADCRVTHLYCGLNLGSTEIVFITKRFCIKEMINFLWWYVKNQLHKIKSIRITHTDCKTKVLHFSKIQNLIVKTSLCHNSSIKHILCRLTLSISECLKWVQLSEWTYVEWCFDFTFNTHGNFFSEKIF